MKYLLRSGARCERRQPGNKRGCRAPGYVQVGGDKGPTLCRFHFEQSRKALEIAAEKECKSAKNSVHQ